MTSISYKTVSGFYQNCRGLRTKLVNFKCNIACINLDFLALTETWLNDSFYDAELGLTNYNIYRFDRCSNTSCCLRSGGVLIGIRKDISSNLYVVPEIGVEHLFVEFRIGTSKFLICCVYFPPQFSSILYENVMSTADNKVQSHCNHTIIICGDFNLPEISWCNDKNGLTFSSYSHIRIPCVPEIFAFNGFFSN